MSEPRNAHFSTALGAPGGLIGQRIRDRVADRTSRGAAVLVGAALAVALLTLRYDAPMVVAALLCAFGLVYMVLRPAVATVVTLFVVYANLPVLAVRQFGVPTLVAASTVLLLGLPLAHYLLLERQRLRSDRTFAFMLLFLAVMAASATLAPAPEIAVARMRVYLLEGIVLYWLILNVVRDLPSFRRVVWTLLVAGALLGALGTWQAVTGSYGRSFGGLAHRQVEVISADQGLDEETVRLRTSNRAEGPVDEPNRFAQILIVLLPLALFCFRCGASRLARFAAALTGAFVLAGVFLTYSRGAFLVLVALTAAMVGVGWLRARHAIALTLVVTLGLSVIAPTYHQRIASIAGVRGLLENRSQVRADGAIRGRTTEMLAALNVFADHPVLGVGPGQYAPMYSVEYQNLPGVSFRDISVTRRAHSLYLEMAAELGIVGLAVFLAMVGLQLRDLMRGRGQAGSREMSELSTALALGLAAYLGTALFLHLSFERYFWILLALTSAGLHLVRGSVAAADGGGGPWTPLQVPPRPNGPMRRAPGHGLVTSTASGRPLRAHPGVVRAGVVARALAARAVHRVRSLRSALLVSIEEIRSHFVFRALDAFLTAPLLPIRSAGLKQIVFPVRQSHYKRVQTVANTMATHWPVLVARARMRLIRADRLPLTGYLGPVLLGYGAGCTAFRLAARPGVDGARHDAVLKVVRKTLGRAPRSALLEARESRAAYQRISRVYEGADLIVPTTFLVLHAPLLGTPAAVTIQPKLDRSARDLFLDFTDRELLAALRSDDRFAQQLRLFVARTSECLRTTGRCLDLVGRGNVLVVATCEGLRMKVIDFGEMDLDEWARSKPQAEREARRRIARLERVSVPKGVNPRVEKVMWPR